jgi:hypothetical protein
MKTQHVFSASAAAVLALTMAAFAQTPQSSRPATPADQSKPATPDNQQPPSAQTSRQSQSPITLVGCVMRETDYRKANNSGKGGPLGTGVGRGDEYVLVNAEKVASGSTPAATAGECGTSAAGEAYELGGSQEKQLSKYVGRRVEIDGILKAAKTTTGANGEAKPTGGVDPLNQDLKLFEVDITRVRELPAGQSTAVTPQSPPSSARPAAPASPSASPAQPEPQPSTPSAPAAPRQRLPRTASPLPLIGLVGLLSLVSGLALRRLA